MLSSKKMLIHSAWQVILTGAFATFLAAQATAATQNYSPASLSGTFILCENGTIQQSQNEYSVVATLTMDGAGNIIGTENIAAGAFSQTGNAVTGTYTVNPSGWGSLALVIAYSDGSGTIINANYMAILSTQGVMITRSDNGVFAQSQLMPQSPGVFSNTSVNGTFVMQEHGYKPTGPFSIAGVLTLDGQGNVSGNANYQSLGVNYMAAISGIYTINADRSESMTLTLTVTNPDGSTNSTNFNYYLNLLSAGAAAGISSDPGTTSMVQISGR